MENKHQGSNLRYGSVVGQFAATAGKVCPLAHLMIRWVNNLSQGQPVGWHDFEHTGALTLFAQVLNGVK
jgi:hypothetical protein